MNANRKCSFMARTSGDQSRELSKRVERLEVLRSAACQQRDRARIAFIDRLIKNTILEWCDSFVTGQPTVQA